MRIAPEHASRKWLRFRAFCLSWFKREWQIEDYPRALIDQLPLQARPNAAYRYRVDVPGWLGLSGAGETPEAAAMNLSAAFAAKRKIMYDLPRPGMSYGSLTLADDARVSADPDLQQRFISDVLRVTWAFISDESSLWDFHEELDNSELNDRILQTFGVDVGDIPNGNIAAIFDRIRAEGRMDRR